MATTHDLFLTRCQSFLLSSSVPLPMRFGFPWLELVRQRCGPYFGSLLPLWLCLTQSV